MDYSTDAPPQILLTSLHQTQHCSSNFNAQHFVCRVLFICKTALLPMLAAALILHMLLGIPSSARAQRSKAPLQGAPVRTGQSGTSQAAPSPSRTGQPSQKPHNTQSIQQDSARTTDDSKSAAGMPTNSSTSNEVDIIWGVKIPTRDGIRLNATLVKPKDSKTPLPVIFTFTPYISDTYLARAVFFAKNGYHFALVDVRGRGNSEGIFEPFAMEGRDGYDVTEWLAAQSWSNGKVTMWGGSYAGWNQWATLKESPPHLATIVPVASCYPGVDFPMTGNIFSSYDIRWLTFTSGVTSNSNLFGLEEYWNQKFRDRFVQHIPFAKLDSLTGNMTSFFQTWLKHPTPDEYWDAASPTPKQYERMNVPILTITGHYDGDQLGAITYYKLHQRHAPPSARESHYLIIGPWDHAGTRSPTRNVGGIDFGAACLLNMNQIHKQWYDWTLKGSAKPEFLQKRVAYYVVAANPAQSRWKFADNLESIANARRTLYLSSNTPTYLMSIDKSKSAESLETLANAQRIRAWSARAASDVFHSGDLTERKPADELPDQYIYNPLDVTAAEREVKPSEHYITDQNVALQLNGNGVIYHTEPFTEDTEVSGHVRLTLWMSIDAPDTDFQALLYEILPDGTSVLLTSDQLRARYRLSLRTAQPVKIGEIARYEFTQFPFFSRLVSKGSRLRLVVTSPNSIFLQKNYNSGGDVSLETARNARTVRVSIYHNATYPSALELPLVLNTKDAKDKESQ